jgi:hypothetical protein
MSMNFTIQTADGEDPEGKKAFDVGLSNGSACLMIEVLGLNHDGISTHGEHPAADMLTKIAAASPTQAQRDQMESHGLELGKVIEWFKALAEDAVRLGIPNVTWH